MALTDDERKELGKLTKEELIEALGQYRDDAERARKADRAEVLKKFFNGSENEDRDAEEEDEDIFDLSKNKAFQELKKRLK